ncbi:MAG: penicillin-binding protein 1A [Pseudomonadota bacterium]
MEHDLFKQENAPLVAERREPPQSPRAPRGESDAPRLGGRKFVGVALNIVATLFGIGMLGAIAAGGGAALYLNNLSQDLPDYQQLADYAPPVTTRVYAGDGSLVAEFARERRIFVPIDAIPDLVKQAFISAEDKSFYEHGGVDMKGVVRSQISNISNILNGRRLEGGSTITQQVAKNFLLSSEQRIERKLREWLIARRIERAYEKDEILELYLNEIYLGNRSYGVAAAALNYFDKSLDELTVQEAAYLAAIPKGPSNYHPVRNRERATERRNWVIGRMVEDGELPADIAEAAKASPLDAEIAPPLGARDWAAEYFAEEVRKQVANRYGAEGLYDGGLSIRTTLDPRLQDAAGATLRKWLVEYDRRHGWRGPIDTLDLAGDDAEALEPTFEAVADHSKIVDDLAPWRPAIVLEAGDKTASIALDAETRGVIPLDALAWARAHQSADTQGPEVKKTSDVLNRGDLVYVSPLLVDQTADGDNPDTDAVAELAASADAPQRRIDGAPAFELQQPPSVNGALVALDPHTGRVLAMVGGFSFQLSEFNRAVQALRQPGSTFKPFVYAAALDSGYTPSSIVLDAPFVAPSIDSWWKPGNYVAGRFYGESTLRLGIEQSRNTMTARLAQDLGIGRIVEYASRFKLSDRLPRELAISLGSGETTLMRLTAGYATFVNGGKSVEPFLVDRIQDRTGATIFREDDRACEMCSAALWQGQEEPNLEDAREQAIDPRTAYQMVSMLEGVVARGTGSRVRRMVEKPVAGKTGTTNEYKDAWFVGFAPDLAVGVFVGFDLPTTLGQGEAGGKVAAPIFGDFMSEALAETPGVPFRVPSGIRLVRVNAKSGRPAAPGEANVILEAFKAEDTFGDEPVFDDGFDLDPLAEGPVDEVEPSEDLNGLY